MKVSVTTEYHDGKASMAECIRSGLALVGDTSADVIVYHITSRLGLGLDELPDNPLAFVGALKEMFGEGAKPIFLSILRELLMCSYRGVEFSPLAMTLADALGTAARREKEYLSRPARHRQ